MADSVAATNYERPMITGIYGDFHVKNRTAFIDIAKFRILQVYMNKIYLQLREEARKIVATLPAPQFYQRFAKERDYARQMLHSHPLLTKIKKEIKPVIEDDFGHGMLHSDLVCVDAGAIIQIEMQKQPETTLVSDKITKTMLLVQVAGLLHDIKRKEKQHSRIGADFTRTFLSAGRYPFTPDEIDIICIAISEHEAFQKVRSIHENKTTVDQNNISDDGAEGIDSSLSLQSSLISNALYDSDKFRWGPDNFTHTLWDMVIFSNAPVQRFVKRYPDGMAILQQIISTFRTETGKLYGPDFIKLGIEAGNQLFKIIKALNLISQ